MSLQTDPQGAEPGRAPVAFVLGGGGVWGSTQVGKLRALAEAGIVPDQVVGTSVGALNGALVASDPSSGCAGRDTVAPHSAPRTTRTCCHRDPPGRQPA